MGRRFQLPKEFFQARLVNVKPTRLIQALGYDPGPNQSMELTAKLVAAAATIFIEEGHIVEGQGPIREVYVEGFWLLCAAGIPAQIFAELKFGVSLPASCEDQVCFFVLHARRGDFGGEV